MGQHAAISSSTPVCSLHTGFSEVITTMCSLPLKARWQSGHAADCNSVYAGSIPTRASNSLLNSVIWHHAKCFAMP